MPTAIDIAALRGLIEQYAAAKARWIERHGSFDESAFHAWFSGQVGC
jgi:hypothetical protein